MDIKIIRQKARVLDESFYPAKTGVYRIEQGRTALRSAIASIAGVEIDVKSPDEMSFLHALSP